MNAPAGKDTLARMMDAAYELIPLANIAPSETHIQKLRRARYSMENLADLRASIAKLGVQQPVVVRKLAALRGLAAYELVAGERRFRAAGQANLAHIPAVIRQLTDEEVLEIQLVENLQREDLHPLEEAAGYEELMKVGKLKKEELADKVGKSRSWVYARMDLLKLPSAAKDALQSGQIDVSRAMAVGSAHEPERQARVLELAMKRDHNNNYRYSVRQLRAEMLKDRLVFPLTGAPFPADDADLVPTAGACGPCPYRTANCDPEAADPNVCTNVPCYERKVKAHGDRRRAEVLAKGGKVLKGEEARKLSPSVKTVYGHVDLDLVCEWDEFPEPEPKDVDYDNTSDPSMVAWRTREEAWQPRTYRALLEGEKYQSVLIDDPKTKQLRELVPFKVAQQLLKKKGIDLPSYANRHRPTFERSAPAAGGKADDAATAKAKREAEEKKRQLEEQVDREVTKRVLVAIKAKHDGSALGVAEIYFLAQAALSDDLPDEIWDAFDLKDPGWQIEKALDKLSSKDLIRFVAAGIVSMGIQGYGSSETRKLADALLGRLKIDPKKIEADVRESFKAKAEASAPKQPAKKGKGK